MDERKHEHNPILTAPFGLLIYEKKVVKDKKIRPLNRTTDILRQWSKYLIMGADEVCSLSDWTLVVGSNPDALLLFFSTS